MQEYRGVDSVSMARAEAGEMMIERGFQGMEEYHLLVQPGLDICAMIKAEKQYLYDQFPEYNTGTGPEIVLGVFLAREAMEETLIRWIQRVCVRSASFMVSLNNYSSFPPHTIYLRVQDHHPFVELTKQLNIIDEYIRSGGSPGVRWHNRPYLNIGGRLTEAQYEKAIREYAPKTFNVSFLASELILVKRRSVAETGKLVNRFHLLPSN